MKYLAIGCLILSIALPVEAGTDSPTSDLRCDQYIILRGARQSEVLRKCGEPSYVETWEKESIQRDFYKNNPVLPGEQLFQGLPFSNEHIRVEEWEYNFGPTRFLYYLRFENGRLIRITVGDYGY